MHINNFFRGPVYTESQANELDLSLRDDNIQLQRQGYRRHKAKIPCYRIYGPRIRIIIDPAIVLGIITIQGNIVNFITLYT